MTFKEYLAQIPEDRKDPIEKLRKTLLENLPKGFEERIGNQGVSYVIPHSIYPDGYHCNPKDPLPFVSFISQKNFIALYHMGVYGIPKLLEWFVNEYPKYSKSKLDMGKSCIRFKKVNEIPFDLIAELVRKVTPQKFIEVYESHIKN